MNGVSNSDAILVVIAIFQGLGTVAMFLFAFVLKDLRDRVSRVEDFLMGSPGERVSQQFSAARRL